MKKQKLHNGKTKKFSLRSVKKKLKILGKMNERQFFWGKLEASLIEYMMKMSLFLFTHNYNK